MPSLVTLCPHGLCWRSWLVSREELGLGVGPWEVSSVIWGSLLSALRPTRFSVK